MDPGQSNLPQQFCQSINTFWANNFFGQDEYLGKTFLVQKNILALKKMKKKIWSENNLWQKMISNFSLIG